MVLVAEDNEILRELTLQQLATFGLKAEPASNGLEVLERVSTRRYDLILMDISMPQMDGFEAVRALRKTEDMRDCPRTPVVAVTGVSERSVCLDNGLDDFVAKPMMLDKLKEVLERWLPRIGNHTRLEDVIESARAVLKQRRLSLKLSSQEVAEKAGLKVECVESIEGGSQDIELSALCRLARVLDLGVSELVAWAELMAREGGM